MSHDPNEKAQVGGGQATLFDVPEERPGRCGAESTVKAGHPVARKRPRPREPKGPVLAIQDLLWQEGRQALHAVESFQDQGAFEKHLGEELRQNSDVTRRRYVSSLIKWFFPDGLGGLAAKVWGAYRDPALADEILRYLYLRAEPMVAAVVADALFPIAENAVVPASYFRNFLHARWGAGVPDKSINRVKMNLRKLGFIAKEKGKDVLRPAMCSATGFLIVLHNLFASGQVRSVEFRPVVDNPFWKYLGFKSEDRLREILRESLARGVIAKYVIADRIESINFRYSFDEFIDGRIQL